MMSLFKNERTNDRSKYRALTVPEPVNFSSDPETSRGREGREKGSIVFPIVDIPKPNHVIFANRNEKDCLFYDMASLTFEKYANIRTPQAVLDYYTTLSNEQSIMPDKDSSLLFLDIGGQFVKDSIKLNRSRGIKVSPVEFTKNWPTIHSMNTAQKNWYLYWRENVLKENYFDTDLSYIFIFLYELINYSFNINASFNVSIMERIYLAYRDLHPVLDSYVPRWICDFLLELGEMELAREWNNYENVDLESLAVRLSQKDAQIDKIPFGSWKPYIDGIVKNELYRSSKEKIYDAFKTGVALLCSIYEKDNVSVTERWFKEKAVPQKRFLYKGAVFARDAVSVVVNSKSYDPSQVIRDELTAIYRASEGILGEILQGKATNTDCHIFPEGFREEFEAIIKSRYVKEHSWNTKGVQKEAPERIDGKLPQQTDNANPDDVIQVVEMEFDNDWIETLNRKSDELAEIFSSGKDIDDNEGSNPDNISSVNFEDDIFLSFEHQTECPEDFIKSLSPLEKEFLNLFENFSIKISDANAFFKSRGTMSGTVIDSINEKANEHLGDNMIEIEDVFYVIYEDYHEIHMNLRKE